MPEIKETKNMSVANFNGRLHLDFLPYSGGYYEQPAPILERKQTIIKYLNKHIDKNDD